ncbi:MAG: archaeal proteasome endopeptidase complex subunit beta [Candidatus Methanomethylicia archaeon]|nr:archaeal proteasome endopeptidase complex subunit beta [Candidatus Methanomethylicia archaeon]MCX8169340.1 archaeal proteasome endopeptidase complex subunit beta [Candidatus Methanomethylicia archaeon]MDW7988877.1 archaeal proteasome endopeptidase complex subunit beta [Nitrososphaerota archaeon]
MNKVIRSGTTTVGLVCSDGVIVASDRRATAGFFIAHPHVKKIYRLDDHIVATIAGIVAHAQEVMNITSANIRLYRYTYNRAINVKAAASLISNLLAQARAYPFIIQLLIGGVDKSGPHLFALDPFGTLTEEKYAATGSGASVAIGILEDSFKKGLHVNEAMDVVIRAISSAMKRDPASGGGYDIAIVTSYGIREYSSEKLSVK